MCTFSSQDLPFHTHTHTRTHTHTHTHTHLYPRQESDAGVHECLSLWDMDDLSRNAQMIIQMLHFGAYQEILGVDGAKPLGI